MTTKSFTAAIIGGGPAGCQCALWLKMMGFSPIIIEPSDHLGGLQAQSPYQNQWIAGVMDVSGREFAHNIQKHIQQKEIPVMFGADVSSCMASTDGFTLDVGGTQIQANYVVIASGSIHRNDAGSVKTSAAQDQAAHDTSFAKQSMTAHNGWQANLPDAFRREKGKLLNQDGFIITNAECETPHAGIYAIGEAANRMHPCVITSMADGVVAAKAIQMISES